MPQPPLKLEVAQEAVYRVEVELRRGCVPKGRHGGGKSAVAAAGEQAVADGWIKRGISLEARLRAASELYGLEPDWSLYRAPRYQQPVAKLQLLPAPRPLHLGREGEPKRLLVIPDRHRDPRHPHRLEWDTIIWRYGSDIKADWVIDLGDDLTMDSCSKYDRNDTVAGRYKPPINADLEHQVEMCQAEERGRDPLWKPRKIKCRGNHNQRLFAFENNHPETEGSLTNRYLETLAQFGWREYGFGEIVHVEGVGFTHAPFNGLGKPMGGKSATHRAGALLTASLVHGHTHSFEIHSSAKLGMLDKITIIQAGCALPPGEVEHYALHSPTGWSYGVLDMWVQDGEILDVSFKSLELLRKIYSDDGADVRAA